MTLEERAVKAKGFRWLPGMMAVEPPVPALVVWPGGEYTPGPNEVGHVYRTRVSEGDTPEEIRESTPTAYVSLDEDGITPDLTDPATLGCLLALVRDAWGDPLLYAESWDRSPGNPGWVIQLPNETIAKGDTEAACLIAALESAP